MTKPSLESKIEGILLGCACSGGSYDLEGAISELKQLFKQELKKLVGKERKINQNCELDYWWDSGFNQKKQEILDRLEEV